jgi:predicted transcriptional regulator
MEVNMSPELQAKRAHIAAENNSGAEEYVRQLVEHYLDHDAWFRQKVKAGLNQLGQAGWRSLGV